MNILDLSEFKRRKIIYQFEDSVDHVTKQNGIIHK